MSGKHPASEHHTTAADEHDQASKHHREAAKNYDEGKHETAAHHARLEGRGHEGNLAVAAYLCSHSRHGSRCDLRQRSKS